MAGPTARLWMTAGSFGFSTKESTERSSRTRIRPSPSMAEVGRAMAAMVTSAPVRMCWSRIRRKSIR